jgi:TolB-like protein
MIARTKDRSAAFTTLFLFDKFSIDPERRELRRDGELCSVEPQVFDLLEYLVRNRNRVVSRDDVLAAVWNGRIVSEATLASRISAARKAIGDNGDDQRLIRTILHKGVRFVGAVREEQESADAAALEPAPNPALPDKPSIAVLPFINMSGDAEQDYFAEGMAEEIITALSRCSWLFVIARNSSFTYRGKAIDVRQVGRELGVRYVLEGSVRRGGDRLRFTGQLIEAASGVHIWADRFDGKLSDVFDLQDQFTESVVAAIEPALQLAEIERQKHRPATNLDAYDLLLRAQQLQYEFTREGFAAALRYLGQSLLIDPSYAPAMALAAYCHTERCEQGWTEDPEADAKNASRLASRAVELGKDDATVLWMAARATMQWRPDMYRTRELVYRSLRLNPNSAIAMATAAQIEASMGDPHKALDLLARAERLSPRDPRGWFITWVMSLAYFMEDRFAESAAAAKKSLNHNPRSTLALRLLAASLAKQGDLDGAAEVMREMRSIEPQLTLTRLRSRLMHFQEDFWQKYSEALRLAGLPQ